MKNSPANSRCFREVFLVFLLVCPLHFVSAHILMSSGDYSQNFDSLATTGSDNAWTDNVTLPGWYAAKGNEDATNYLAGTGSSFIGGFYSFGVAGVNAITDRALGSLGSGSAPSVAYGIRFTNDTGLTVTNILISYTGEQWRNANGSGAVTNTLSFSFQVANSPLTNADAADSQSWTRFSDLDFNSPIVDVGGSGTALDGNASANRQIFTAVPLAGIEVHPGQEIFLRWRDVNDGGSDAGLAIDDLTVHFETAGTSSNPPVILSQPADVTATAGDTVLFSVAANGTWPLSYQWQSNSVPVPGATNSTLTLANVTTNLSGSTYYVIVTNAFGATNSDMATLTVNPVQSNNATGAAKRILRIGTCNIQADITLTNEQPTFTNVVTEPGSPLPGLVAPPTDPGNFAAGGVLEGIGEEIVNGNAQPLDVLALQETTSNPSTIAPIVNALNLFYGVPGMYSNSTYQATESGNYPGSGNGPNAVIYNTRTVRLLASVPVDPPGGTSRLGSASGEYREVMRYQFAPAGVASNADDTFYLYVSHYKSGTGSSNTGYRDGEAAIIRTDAATLPSNARVLHVGDFNTGDAGEPMYGTLIGPGTNQFLDPINPAGSTSLNWDGSSPLNVKTESAALLHYRDDYEMMTTNVYFGAGDGLALVPGSYHVFGNNGSTPYFGSVNSGSNTSLNNRLVTNGPVFISAARLYVDLTGASDHLPVVADYAIPVPAPRITGVLLQGAVLSFNVSNAMTNADYTLLAGTHLTAPPASWTPIATNTAAASSFVFTTTNFNEAVKFFRVKTK